jgi:hypothetical protein
VLRIQTRTPPPPPHSVRAAAALATMENKQDEPTEEMPDQREELQLDLQGS